MMRKRLSELRRSVIGVCSQRKGIAMDCSGVTMVEVIVAFTILVLMMGIFSQAAAMTSRNMIKSGQILTDYRELAGEYYLSDGVGTGKTESSVTLQFGGFSIDAKKRVYKNENGEIVDVVPVETAAVPGT